MSRRFLTRAERDLWRRVTQDVSPMGAEEEQTVRDVVTNNFKNSKAYEKKRTPSANGGGIKMQLAMTKAVGNESGAADLFRAGDPRMDRRAGRGRLPIEATLDLHGHTQTTAKTMLLNFLQEAGRRRYRCVLVITGKGARSNRGHGAQHGVLRAKIGEWVAEDMFRELIVRISRAHSRHGGEGAYYIFLRQDKRSAPPGF